MRRVLLAAVLVLASNESGLSDERGSNSPTQSQVPMTTYVVGVIRKGPNWGTGTPSERQRIQDGHMANIRKMADTGKLIAAGPFENDQLRGLFIFGVSSTEEARALVNEDPAVVAGRLTVDLYQWYAPAGLRVDLQTVSLPDSSREHVVQMVSQIQRADYEGDHAALKRFYGELAPVAQTTNLASRVRYWRGFALWRRAMNGFNESVDPNELEEDLTQAIREFDEAVRLDPGFVDAKVGAISCLSNLIFLNRKNAARVQELAAQAVPLRKEAEAAEPANPRLLWVLAPICWYAPPEHGCSQGKAMEMDQRGLEAARKQMRIPSDPLEPSWGEPELLAALAWVNLHRAAPDLNAAEQYARSALGLVPYWHYVRDILIPQIQEAKKKPQ
jgi:uncharacterized protein